MRPSWDQYFMDIAHLVKTRSTCTRRQVGAVVVKDKQILSTGYNGAPTSCTHCIELGCMRTKLNIPSGERHELCRALHAEQNAITQAAKNGTAVAGAVIYVTAQPCSMCAKVLINSGIAKIIYQGNYPDPLAIELLNEAKIHMEQFGTIENESNRGLEK
ncbi:deoxycytidylate deaminase [Candidatus Epulonipiscium viviparus]|uniref:deoxycytidylate deaminase n=1 Tax=Candidatus Epulonipiscium viviparus TaxID=420336 RepID=UPI00016C0B3D|nr:dCMP deaminase family protein [Candidatus Epulopiscium viviparus]